MADILYKARREKELYSVDFSNDLASGETISTATVRVLHQSETGSVTDKSTEFDPTTPSVSGSTVTFFLLPATSSTEQEEGTYGLEVLATTSQGRVTAALTRDYKLPQLKVRAI